MRTASIGSARADKYKLRDRCRTLRFAPAIILIAGIAVSCALALPAVSAQPLRPSLRVSRPRRVPPTSRKARRNLVASPTNVIATAGNLANTVTWNRVADRRVAGYRIYRSKGPKGPFVLRAKLAASARTYKDRIAVTALGVYDYRVVATDKARRLGRSSATVAADTLNIASTVSPLADTPIIASTGELVLDVPAGAVMAPTVITIKSRAAPAAFTTIDAPLTGAYDFGPDGTVFSAAAMPRLTLHYAQTAQGDRFESEWIARTANLYFYDSASASWVAAGSGLSVDAVANTLSGDLAHFTTYAGGFTVQPHGRYTSTTNLCATCHDLHTAGGGAVLKAENVDMCWYCHGASMSTITSGAGSHDLNIQSQFYNTTDTTTTGKHIHPVVTRNVVCVDCHTPHRDPNYYPKLLFTWVGGTSRSYNVRSGSGYPGVPIAAAGDGNKNCLGCHGATPATRVLASDPNYYSVTNGDHSLGYDTGAHGSVANTFSPSPGATDTVGQITNRISTEVQCEKCHADHGATNTALLLPAINGQTVSGNNRTVCYGCHTNATTGWPTYSRDNSGYPDRITNPGGARYGGGTWPSKATYETTFSAVTHMGSAHETATVVWPGAGFSGGECQNCHDVHTTQTATYYDFLRARYSSGGGSETNASAFAVCFKCHDGSQSSVPTQAVDISRYYTGAGATAGHKIVSSVGNLVAGDGMPCYDCHNPHGSASAFGLMVDTQMSAGTTIAIGDISGEITLTMPAASASQVRVFCFSCHTTADTVKGWNGAAMAVVTAGARVEGIDRTTNTAGQVLRLPDVNGHHEADLQSCYSCHGNQDYSSASSNNVHNPSGGSSNGGQACYTCHSTYKTAMEDGVGTQTGANRTLSYHHVLGGIRTTTYYDGDTPTSTMGGYPGTGTSIFCLTCHGDHDTFNSNKAFNLRTSPAVMTGVTTNTDHQVNGGGMGLCVGCHAFGSYAKDTTNQLSYVNSSTADPSTMTVNVNLPYDASAHQYEVTSTFSDGSVFRANCSKCHSDNQASMQTSPRKFSTHYTPARRLLSAFGGTSTDPLDQQFCFKCHSTQANGFKPTAGRDYYGAAGHTMSFASEKICDTFSFGVFTSHPVTATARGAVKCVNCHNPHLATATTPVVDPANTYIATGYATLAQQVTFCLRCHGGVQPAYSSPVGPYVPATVTINIAGAKDKTTNQARSHWVANGSISSTETTGCGACHDPHASRLGSLVGVYDPVSDTQKIAGQVVASLDGACLACHSGPSTGYPTFSRTASGYPMDGTWPGGTTYTASKHAGTLCRTCHDPHGTIWPYDETRGNYAPDNFMACLNGGCHNGGVDAGTYYPTTAGGTAVQDPWTGNPPTTRYGHRTLSAGNLPAGSALPCYDCHNPHGSADTTMLCVVTQSQGTTLPIGDQPGEIDMSTNAGIRKFCFACHTTADTGQGWTGAVWQSVRTTDQVEGINRFTYLANGSHLRLPSVSGHNFADAQSCYQCHGNTYAAGGNNVHNPTVSGASSGGQNCYGCHSEYQNPMESSGTSRTLSYHHVLGGGAFAANGDTATVGGTGPYPTSATDVYCISCHADHNYFNSYRGSNLRSNIVSSTVTTSATDFVNNAGLRYGVCVSCHQVSLARDTGNQKAGEPAQTMDVSGTLYAMSAHQYTVDSSYGAAASDAFHADCSKCHTDEQTKSIQTSASKFGPHFSAEKRIIAAFGLAVPASGQTEEAACFKCHSGNVAGPDYYNAHAMSINAKSIQSAITAAGSAHTVGKTNGTHKSVETSADLGSANRHVECEDCHDPHASVPGTHTAGNSAGAAALRGAWGVQPTYAGTAWTAPSSWTTMTFSGAATNYEAYLCFKCHSTYVTLPVSVTTTSGTYGPTDLALEFNPNNDSGHNVLGASTWPKSAFLAPHNGYTWAVESMNLAAPWTNTSQMTCTDCHYNSAGNARGPHGSAMRYILKWGTAGTDWWATTLTNWANAQNFCNRCHTAAGSNTTHASGNHSGYSCNTCHIKVPHGWKRPRLIGYWTDTGLYQTANANALQGIHYYANFGAGGPARADCYAACSGQHPASGPYW